MVERFNWDLPDEPDRPSEQDGRNEWRPRIDFGYEDPDDAFDAVNVEPQPDNLARHEIAVLDTDQPDTPAPFDAEVRALVPDRIGGEGKTRGRFVDDAGNVSSEIISTYAGRSAELAKPRPGMNGNILSHVEAHAAATMRLDGITEGTLYINNPPCPGPRGCDKMLPRMLPPDSKLTVYGPDEYVKIYRGLSEDDR